MSERWQFRYHDSHQIASLERLAGVPAVVAQLLAGRGISDPDQARSFLAAKLNHLHDPQQLPGVAEAARRVLTAIRDQRRIVIHGDYDADGMTGTAILVHALGALQADVGYFVPNRMQDGYGVSVENITKLAARGAQLVVSVDCGIASLAAAEKARELGVEFIVTDHHEFASELPNADAIVHPRLPGHSYPFGFLCGAGVAFKLAWAIFQQACQAQRVSESLRSTLLKCLGLAAIGTIADVVPLVEENRLIARHGLLCLKNQPPLGIQALMELTGLTKKPQLDSEDVGFTLAPRLNAAGRLGQAPLGVELLITESADRAAALSEYLNELNSSRESLERKIYLSAKKQATEQFDPVHDAALVLADRDWHPGVIGIVAGKLSEKFHRPVILIALDEFAARPGIGSCRSPAGLSLHEGLAACSEHLISHGGHAAAAGLKIEDAQVDPFRAAFSEFVEREMSADDRVASIRIDAEAPLSQLTLQTVRQIEQLAPFGHANPRPILCASRVRLASPPKKMGGGERHLGLRLTQHQVTLRGVAFGQSEWADEMAQTDGLLDIAFEPKINEYNGQRSVELKVVDWQVAEGDPAEASGKARPARPSAK